MKQELKQTIKVKGLKGVMTPCNVAMTNRTFKHLTEDLEVIEYKKMSLEFESKVFLNTITFYRTLDFFKKMGIEIITFKVESYHLVLIAENVFTKINIKIPLIDVEKGIYADVESNFNPNYLINFFKEYGVNNLKKMDFELKLEMGKKDYPLRLTLNNDWIILSPKIIND